MSKKLLSLALALVMCLSLCVPAWAAEDNSGYLIYESGEISQATISDIDTLTHERNLAILEGNQAAADSIREQLYDMGGRPSTAEELATISGPNAIVAANSGNYNFTTYTYQAVVNNKTYDIKRIDCAAFDGCNLYHNGNISTTSISGNASAASFNVCKAVGATLVGSAYPEAGAALTVYDLVSGYLSDISPRTIVENISSSYTYTFLEQCSFYSYKVNNTWTPYAATSFLEAEIVATIMGLKYNGKGFSHIDNQHGVYNATIYANRKDYNAASQLKTYFNSYLFNHSSQLTGFCIEDTNGNSLLSRGLVCPYNTSDIY